MLCIKLFYESTNINNISTTLPRPLRYTECLFRSFYFQNELSSLPFSCWVARWFALSQMFMFTNNTDNWVNMSVPYHYTCPDIALNGKWKTTIDRIWGKNRENENESLTPHFVLSSMGKKRINNEHSRYDTRRRIQKHITICQSSNEKSIPTRKPNHTLVYY